MPLAMVLGVLAVGVIYIAMNVTYVYALPLKEIAAARNHRARGGCGLVLPGSGSVAFADDCDLVLQRSRNLHPLRRASLSRHGAGWSLLQAHGGDSSQVANTRFQPDRSRHVGRVLTLSGRYDQLYTYVIYGMVLSYTLTVIAMFWLRWKRPEIPRPYRCTGYPWLPANIRIDRRRLDLNTIFTRPTESVLGHGHRAGRRSFLFVLEAQQPQGCVRSTDFTSRYANAQ